MNSSMYYLGLDLGQKRDHSAIAVVEQRDGSPDVLVRRVERVPLGTPYPEVVARVRIIVRNPALLGRCALTVDATGLGAPVVDALRAAQLGCEITAVTITGGARATGSGSRWGIPKQDLIAGLVVLLENRQLRIARKTRDAGALVRELMDVRMTESGHRRPRIGAGACGEHDDLAIALALACWRAKRGTVGDRRAGRLDTI